MKTFSLVVSVLFCWSICFAEDRKPPLLTFVLAGQSNMVGKRCLAKELPDELQKPNPNVLFFDAKDAKWIPLEPGKTQARGFGPEVAFGAEIAELLDQPIGIVKHSVGGTNLAVQWNPYTPGKLYSDFSEKVNAARASRDLKIAGMLWVQGGADAKQIKMAESYAENLKRLAEKSRELFANPDMAFVSGRIPPKSNKTKPHWPLVRAAQQDLQLDNYAWVDCDSISVGPDRIHFDTSGMVQLGKAQAEIMAGLLQKK